MSAAIAIAADLLAECGASGIDLFPNGTGGLTIDAPRDTLTPQLLARLKFHKAEVLAMLRPNTEAGLSASVEAQAMPAESAAVVCRCGSTTWRDVPIHDWRSVRRDCGRCRRFIDFTIWYGSDAGQNG